MGTTMKPKIHRGHTHCPEDSICVPHFLHDQFCGQLGPRQADFDFLLWYLEQDKERAREARVIADPLTWWKAAFQAELQARGWLTQAKPRDAWSPARTTPQGLVYPCPHERPCESTWACGMKQKRAQEVRA